MAEIGSAFLSILPSAKGFGSKLEKDVGNETEGVGKRVGAGFGKAFGAVAGLAAAAGIGTVLVKALDREAVTDKFAASLGQTPAQAQKFGKIAGALYRDAYGESFEEVASSVAAVQSSFRRLGGDDLQRVAGQAMDFANIFDVDLPRAVSVAQTVVKSGLADSATQALDLLTASAQRVPAALREDVLDAANEYGQFFKAVGFGGEQAFTTLVESAKLGEFGIDKAGDAIKEFTIRSTDGSAASGAAYKTLGLDAGKFSNAILKGGDYAGEATKSIVDGLLSIKDPSKQAQTAIALFGTPLEDLGVKNIPSFLKSLSDGAQGLGDFEGSINRAGQTANDNASTNITKFKRSVEDAFVTGVGGKIIPFFTLVTDAFKEGGVNNVGKVVGDKIKAALPTIRANLKKWGEAFIEWVSPLIKPLLTALVKVLVAVGVWIGGTAVPWLAEKLALLARAWWEWAKEIYPPLLVELGALLSRLGSWITGTALPWLVASLKKWGAAFVEWISPLIVPAIEQLGRWAEALFNWLLDTGLSWLLENLKNWGTALIKWIAPMVPPLLVEIGKLLGKLIAWIVTVGIPKWLKALFRFWKALLKWILPMIPPLLKNIAKLMLRLNAWLTTVALPWLVRSLLKLGVAFLKWIGPQIPKVIKGASGLIGKLATWIISTGLPLVKAKLLELGRKGFAAIKEAAVDKIEDLKTYVGTIGGKIKDAVGDLGNLLRDAGKQVVEGLIGGITDKIGDLRNKVSELSGIITDHFPGSPVKKGPLKSWNHGNGVSGAGRKLADGLADGMKARTGAVKERAKKLAEAIRSQLQTVKSDMASLASSIADSFRPDLFSGNLGNFFTTGQQGKGNLQSIVAAFKKLRGFGLGEKFLSDLYASGNSALILDLASGDKATARSAQSLYDQTNRLANGLGKSVAQNEFGDDITRLANRLEKVLKRLPKETGREVGREINGAATRGRRDARV